MNITISGEQLGEMLRCAAASLNGSKEAVNKLNVFPVPAGDTGTNMSMTLSAAAAPLENNTPATVCE
ncbi:MAG: DAK2 domain-containing protein [Clostridiales bacterium]|nr:DAK2 domain-containing protein [Candidatus Apopatocola equi]